MAIGFTAFPLELAQGLFLRAVNNQTRRDTIALEHQRQSLVSVFSHFNGVATCPSEGGTVCLPKIHFCRQRGGGFESVSEDRVRHTTISHHPVISWVSVR